MKKIIVTISLLLGFGAFAQEQFSGISTSNRVGILNGVINPAEFSNLSKKFEVNVAGISFTVSNNKIGFSDLSSDNIEELIFKGTEPVNARFDGTILGPSVAMKWLKWGFAITTAAHAKFDIVDVDPTIGNAIANNSLILNTTILNNPNNQRLSGTSYGEVGFSASRTIYKTEKHQISVGTTLKVLFPGSYSNFGLSELDGTITQNATGAYLTTNSPATLNVAYSGNLADSFSNFSDYSKSIFGGLNGFSGDVGVNYRLKNASGYKLNFGLSIRNMGSMTYKDDNNAASNYSLNIQPNAQNPQGLDLSLFQNVENLSQVEQILRDKGYLTQLPTESKFKVKLPTTLCTYADFKIIPKLYITAYLQKKLNNNDGNFQITVPNIFSITPRVNLGFFEGYIPISVDDVSGTNLGLGFRLAGFYLGSSSIISSLADGKSADIYTGYRIAFL